MFFYWKGTTPISALKMTDLRNPLQLQKYVDLTLLVFSYVDNFIKI